MPSYVFQYSQGMDIRWYASEPVFTFGSKEEALNAMNPSKRITLENGRWIEWLETSTSFGVCYALAAYWIIRKAKNEDFLDWLKPGSRACPEVGNNVNPGSGTMIADIKSMQLSQRGKECVIKLCDAIEKIKRETGFVTRDSVAVKNGKIKDKAGFSLIVIIGERKGVSNIPDFGGRDGFNHAIATYVIDKSNVLLFDPNRGEIKLDSVGETNAFIEYLCTHPKQYNLKNYSLEWSAVATQRIKKGLFT